MDSLKKKFFFFFLKIDKINLGRTCFDRFGRKSEINNIFFRSMNNKKECLNGREVSNRVSIPNVK